MRAGKLRNRLAVQVKTVTYNSYNEPLETWATDRYLWADCIPSSSREFQALQQVHADLQIAYQVRCELDATLSEQNRIVCDGVTCDIIGLVPDDGRRRMVTILARRLASGN